MIVDIIDKPIAHKIKMDYDIINESPKVFVDDSGNVVGYIWFSINKNVMNIEMIELIEKEQGLGTEAIEFLFKTFSINQITGQVLGENGMRAYWFWESLGAEMDIPVDEIENRIVRDCYFTLSR